MLSPYDIPFTATQQKARISGSLNSTLMLQFLFGIYTGVVPGALFIYSHKDNRSLMKDAMVIGNIVALYCITAFMVLIDWFYLSVGLCNNGKTRLDTFIGIVASERPEAIMVLLDIMELVGFILADALLVWRCFHACGRSLRRSSLPIALFLMEAGLVFSSMVFECLLDTQPGFQTNRRDETFNRLSAATLVSVAVTSLTCTFIICREISTRTLPGSQSRKRYQGIMNALIESAGLYSAALVFEAVLDFLATGSPKNAFEINIIAQYASCAIINLFAGLAPTLMVARLFLSSSEDYTECSSTLPLPDLIGPASYSGSTNIVNGHDGQLEGNLALQVNDLLARSSKDEAGEIMLVDRVRGHSDV